MRDPKPVNSFAVTAEAGLVLLQVGQLGYVLGYRKLDGGGLELTAAGDSYPHARHVVRHLDGDGPNEEYLAACALAEMVGIDLGDG